MTAPDTPVSAVWPAIIYGRAQVYPTPAYRRPAGCTQPGCGTQNTVTVDGRHGRRCPAHPPVFDPVHAVELQRRGAPGAGFAYCRWGGEAA